MKKMMKTKMKTNNKNKNAFANNISTDMKLSEVQIFKIVQSGGSFGSWLGNLGKKFNFKCNK